MRDNKIIVLYLIGQLGVGGAERQLINLVTGLDRDVYLPVVCSLSTNSPLSVELESVGIKVIILPKYMSPDITRAWRLFTLIKNIQPDIIHSYLFVANTWAKILGTLWRIPVIVSERSFEINKPRWMMFIDRLLSQNFSIMIANSYAGADLAVNRKEVAQSKVTCIYNGISIAKFDHAISDLLFRESYGFTSQDILVAMVGRLDFPKDHETFFAAMAQVIVFTPNVRILCAGDGPRLSELKQLAYKYELSEKVIFTGQIRDIPDLMLSIDLMVLCTFWEGLPNVILEAMAASKPVVASMVGGIPEIVVDGVTGRLIFPNKPSYFSKAIQTLLNDKQMMVEMGVEGRKRVEAHFSLDKMIAKTQDIYQRIYNEKNG